MRNLLTNSFVLAMGAALETHMTLIAFLDSVTIKEPNPFVLGLEMASVAGMMALAIFNLIKRPF